MMSYDALQAFAGLVSLLCTWLWVLWDLEGLQSAPTVWTLQLPQCWRTSQYQYRLAGGGSAWCSRCGLLAWQEPWHVRVESLNPVQASQSELDLEKFAASILLEDGPQPAQAGLGLARQSESSLQGSSSEWEAMLLDGSCAGTGHIACPAARPGMDADPGSQPSSATGALSGPHWRRAFESERATVIGISPVRLRHMACSVPQQGLLCTSKTPAELRRRRAPWPF